MGVVTFYTLERYSVQADRGYKVRAWEIAFPTRRQTMHISILTLDHHYCGRVLLT